MAGNGTAATVAGARRRKKPPRNLFEHQESARAAARAAQETPKMAILKKMLKAYAKGYRRAGPPPPPPPLETAKLAARVEKGLARGEPFERAATAALRKSMATPQRADYTAVTEPDDPFTKMWKAAQDASAESGEDPHAIFERIYADPRNREIVQQDKRSHFLKATGAALPLPPSTGPGLRPDQQANYRKPVHGDELTKQVVKLMKRDGLSFEAAATRALRGKAA